MRYLFNTLEQLLCILRQVGPSRPKQLPQQVRCLHGPLSCMGPFQGSGGNAGLVTCAHSQKQESSELPSKSQTFRTHETQMNPFANNFQPPKNLFSLKYS